MTQRLSSTMAHNAAGVSSTRLERRQLSVRQGTYAARLFSLTRWIEARFSLSENELPQPHG